MKKAGLFLLPLFTMLIIFVFTGCETVVDLDLPAHKPVLVANCFFNPDSVMEVLVSNSAGSLDNNQQIMAINTATVEVYENGQLKETLANKGSNGKYVSTFKPVAGKLYELKARGTGFEEITAINTIPAAVPVTSYSFRDSVRNDQQGNTQSEVVLHFYDPPGEINYYSVELYTYDTVYLNFPPGPGDTLLYTRNIYGSTDDPAAADLSYGSQQFFNGEFMDGKNYSLKIQISSYEIMPGAALAVVFHTVNREMFLYLQTFNNQMNNKGNPFSEPVRVYNNVHQGFGIFAGYNSQTIRVR